MHLNFGLGVVKSVEGAGLGETIVVKFIGGDAKTKKFMAKTAPITKSSPVSVQVSAST